VEDIKIETIQNKNDLDTCQDNVEKPSMINRLGSFAVRHAGVLTMSMSQIGLLIVDMAVKQSQDHLFGMHIGAIIVAAAMGELADIFTNKYVYRN
jgi:lipoprotein signal peptidase